MICKEVFADDHNFLAGGDLKGLSVLQGSPKRHHLSPSAPSNVPVKKDRYAATGFIPRWCGL